MAKLTLLEIVQDILNDMDSDPVNSINDSEEGLQVAQIVKTSLFEMYNTRNWPHLRTISQLDTTGSSNPVKLKIPDLAKEIEQIEYNKRRLADTKDKYQPVTYLDPVHFVRKLNKRDSSADNVDTVTDYGLTPLYVRNDIQPTFWTTFDDEFVIMDAYDSEVDTTLQSSKTQVVMYKSPSFQFSDTFVPDLPEEAFSALVAEAKSTSFVALKQVNNAKAEQKVRRSQAWLSRKSARAGGGFSYPNFGRSAGRTRSPYLEKDV